MQIDSNTQTIESEPSADRQPQESDGHLFLYSTTISDVGTVRSNNQDSSFAGERLAAVCDGMGGHAGGDTASTIAIKSLAHLEMSDKEIPAVAATLEKSVKNAHDSIVATAKYDRTLAGMGTTLSAVVLVNDYWVCAHIGDSRGYMLRDDKLRRMTHDHSYVQHLVDTGRISESEARHHPQRNVVMRVLGDFDIDPTPDISIFRAYPGDRWLLCSDGLCGVLEDSDIEDVMVTMPDQQECARRLVNMALKAGSTDNVTAVIADATAALQLDHQTPVVGGAATSGLAVIAENVGEQVITAPALVRAAAPAVAQSENEGDEAADSAGHTDEDVQSQQDVQSQAFVAVPAADSDEDKGDLDTSEIPVVRKRNGNLSADPHDPEVAAVIKREKQREKHSDNKRKVRKRLIKVIIGLLVVLFAALGLFSTYKWTLTQYYIGESDGEVAIYQGVNTNLFGVSLSHAVETTNISIFDLSQDMSEKVRTGVSEDSLSDAQNKITVIRSDVAKQKAEDKKDSKISKDSAKAKNHAHSAGAASFTDAADLHGSSAYPKGAVA